MNRPTARLCKPLALHSSLRSSNRTKPTTPASSKFLSGLVPASAMALLITSPIRQPACVANALFSCEMNDLRGGEPSGLCICASSRVAYFSRSAL